MIAARLKALLPEPLKQRLRRHVYSVQRSTVAAINLVSFFLRHRRFGPVVDQRTFWEARWERDVADIAAVEQDPYYKQLDAAMKTRLGAMQGRTLLEIGCHAGYRLRKFARGEPQRRFVGLDLGFVNLAGGRDRLGEVSNVGLVNANAAALPFADASFDIVYTCVSLTHIDYCAIGKVMAEIGRVVRRHVLLWEVDHRPMAWRKKLHVINLGYFFLHPYEKLAGPAMRLVSITPMPDLEGHPRYTLFEFAKAA